MYSHIIIVVACDFVFTSIELQFRLHSPVWLILKTISIRVSLLLLNFCWKKPFFVVELHIFGFIELFLEKSRHFHRNTTFFLCNSVSFKESAVFREIHTYILKEFTQFPGNITNFITCITQNWASKQLGLNIIKVYCSCFG